MDQNQNIPSEQPAAPATAFAVNTVNVPPFESHVISGFRQLDASASDSLNRDLGTSMTGALTDRIIRHYASFEHRDPTVGELRLLDECVRMTGQLSARVGAGEMLTDSGEMAAVWADVMERRRLLNGSGSEPCTVPELLGLPGRWLTRTGERPAAPEKQLYIGSDAAAHALHDAAVPVVRLQTGDGTPYLLTSSTPRPVLKPLPGDLLALVRDIDVRTADTLLRILSPAPLIAEAVPLDGRPLFMAAADGLDGLSVKLERLCDTGAADAVTRVCRGEGVVSGSGRLTLILRLRADRLRPFFDEVRRYGFKASVFGTVEATGRLTVSQGQYRIAAISLSLLRGLSAPRLCRIRLPEAAVPAPDSGTMTRSLLFRLPLPCAGEDGITPTGCETVAVTSAYPDTCTAAGTALSVVTEVLPDDGTACRRAIRASLAAIAGPLSRGTGRDGLSLSVTLTGRKLSPAKDGQMPVSDGTIWAAACGLYRVSCELKLPITFSDVRFTLTEQDTDSLTVCVCGPAVRQTAYRGACDALLLCPALSDGSEDWDAIRHTADALSAPATPDTTVRAAVPTAVLPVLRKDREADLKALSASLALRGIRCVIHPVRVEMITPPVPEETDTDSPAEAPAPVPTVTQASAQTLVQALGQADMLVLAMSEEDGSILFRDPALLTALTADRKVVTIGSVCRILADAGLLPEVLSRTPVTVPAAGRILLMDFTDKSGSVRTVNRLCRTDLLSYPAEADHTSVIHANGGDVADGFRGLSGDLTAYVNGLPDFINL
ncbi:MAG: hypothetical protein MJ192_02925 [Clostridia bacterium]|nr:hypothetical protein [Clostridia bacterium]